MLASNAYVLMFFVYGLAFFIMGVASLMQSSSNSSFPLQKAIHFLGFFGLVHGVTEWIIMALLSGLATDLRNILVVIGTFTNGLSFVFLWLFGARLISTKSRAWKLMNQVPWIIFVLWLIPYIVYLVNNGIGNISWFLLEDIFSRYFIGLPGSLIVFYAVIQQSMRMKELKLISVSRKMKVLAFLFLTYGIFSGLIVDNKGFFPNTIINKESFLAVTGFPVEIGRASMAIAITVLVVNIIRIFEWENQRKLSRLTKQQIQTQQRNEMGRELHDGIVQHMFVSGLKLEEIIAVESDNTKLALLGEVKEDLNRVMDQLRTFIDQETNSSTEIEDLQSSIQALANGFESNWGLSVDYANSIPAFTYGSLSKDTTTHVYYIIQEALWNAFKHAGASQVTITLTGSITSLIAAVKDNGKGFDISQVPPGKHFGLQHMNERAKEIQGQLSIQSNHAGTTITIIVPWEGSENE